MSLILENKKSSVASRNYDMAGVEAALEKQRRDTLAFLKHKEFTSGLESQLQVAVPRFRARYE